MLDDVMPCYEFREVHGRRVAATTDATWQALNALTLVDLTVTRPLVALRHLARPTTPNEPLLSHGPVSILHREDGRVAIGGAIGRPWQLHAPKRSVADLRSFADFAEPGWTKYLTEFRVEPDARDGHCLLSTETRGSSTDPYARRRFRIYWTVIRLPSGLIRRDILRSVARIAVASGPAANPLTDSGARETRRSRAARVRRRRARSAR